MKKVIALALAMAMAASMTSMALDLTFTPAGNTARNDNDGMYPGETYKFQIDSVDGRDNDANAAQAAELVKSGLASFSVDVSKGTALIDSAKVKEEDGAAYLVVETKENYTITDEKDVEMTVTMTAKKDIRCV